MWISATTSTGQPNSRNKQLSRGSCSLCLQSRNRLGQRGRGGGICADTTYMNTKLDDLTDEKYNTITTALSLLSGADSMGDAVYLDEESAAECGRLASELEDAAEQEIAA